MKKFFAFLLAVFLILALAWGISHREELFDSETNEKISETLNSAEEKIKETANELKEKAEQIPLPVEKKTVNFWDEKNAVPVCNGNDLNPLNNNDHEIHEYSGFTLCYRESYEDAEWVAYILTREELKAVTGRTNDFRPDPSITTGSADLDDYRKSGYDRGHLAPAADMEWSVESCRESFFMSNMTPQAPQLNRGMWQQLESQVRKWADRFGKIMVVTGPVLEKNAGEYSSIGKNKVAVPEYFFKSILAQDADGNSMAISFILPNSKCEGTIWDYCVTTDEVERRCGFDVFSFLPDETEEEIESCIDSDDWE